MEKNFDKNLLLYLVQVRYVSTKLCEMYKNIKYLTRGVN